MGIVPIADEHSQAFWDAAREGRLLIQRCEACGEHQWYPRQHCVHCFATDPEWVQAAGTGRLHTFTVLRKTPNAEFTADLPYAFAIVELDEGVRMATRIVDVPLDELACEMAVRVVFRAGDDGQPLPCFTGAAR
jgi:uncharacterized OB-fold protein